MRGRFALLLLFALTACSPAQEAEWRRWFTVQPRAAVAFATEACGALCTDDWDRDGVVEPEWTDVMLPEEDDDDIDPDNNGWGQCAQWMDDALDAGWTSEQWETLNWIMAAESGCDPSATSSAGAQGLLQVMPFWADECGGGNLYDSGFNLRCALHVWHEQGWTAWDVY